MYLRVNGVDLDGSEFDAIINIEKISAIVRNKEGKAVIFVDSDRYVTTTDYEKLINIHPFYGELIN